MPASQALRRHRLWGFIACLLLALFSTSTQSAQAEPTWTTYHRDAQRSGYDPEATQPIEPRLAWQSTDLGASIWSQPLILGNRVYVATVADDVYALEASTGKVVWQTSVGTPVPSDELPCGDIQPTVGVVGTPVIDLELGAFFVVADRWNQVTKTAEHRLLGLNLENGEEMVSTNVDPPGADPKALLQRTALNLDKGEVIFGYGGNDGDCSDYRGAVVAAPVNGAAPRFWQYQPSPPSTSGGAVWATGGPAVDEAGNVYATTGNPDPPNGEEATVFDYSDSVLKLNPSEDFVADPGSKQPPPLAGFEPPSWQQESNSDEDLGSAAPELLSSGVLFQAGKTATGYLIEESTMKSVYNGKVCSENRGYGGSFGGDAFANGTIYIPCENGVQALAYSQADKSFRPVWQGPEDAVGPPIVSAGLVWSVATGGFSGGGTKLYGLDPATGIPRYTETLPSPVADHFASPSAAAGLLFVADGSCVSAFQIAQLTAGETGPPAPANLGGCASAARAGGQNPAVKEAGAATVAPGLSPLSRNPTKPLPESVGTELLSADLHAAAKGRVRLRLRCLRSTPCSGTIALRAGIRELTAPGDHGIRKIVTVTLASRSFGPASGDFQETLHIGRATIARLRANKNHLRLLVRISSPGLLPRQFARVLT
ncbi:MAG TPA: PQQ-binding-like beta-propeller repeat protein [Solirubrobacteraceae bacterium]